MKKKWSLHFTLITENAFEWLSESVFVHRLSSALYRSTIFDFSDPISPPTAKSLFS